MINIDKLNLMPAMPLSVVTRGVGETEALGRRLSALLLEEVSLPRYVALYGGLGAGKTSFVRGFVSALSTARVKSPTFVLVHEYPASPAPVYHFDMYRIEGEDDLYSVGYYDYLSKEGFILVEWSERIPWALPGRRIEVTIENNDIASPDNRQITMRLICEDSHENTRT
jgi:tRNA threonylcarbamoyladenosine biosynthesis protein TsaE